MSSYEYLPTLIEALANDDGAELDVALGEVFPLRVLFASSLLVHFFELFDFAPNSTLAIFVAVERRLRQPRFGADDARHCAALVRRPRSPHPARLAVPLAFLELRIQLRAFADEDENAPANAAPVDPLRRVDAVANFLQFVAQHADSVQPALRDRCQLARLVAALIVGNEAFAVDRCRLGLDAYYDALVRLQNDRLADARPPPAHTKFVRLMQHNVIHNIALACASLGRFDVVRNIDDVFHDTLGELVLARDLAEGRALRNYVAQPRVVRLDDSVERVSTIMLLAVQHLAAMASTTTPSSYLLRANAPLEAVALATQNMALLLLLESPKESIRQFSRAFVALKRNHNNSSLPSTSAVALLDLDEFLAVESVARRQSPTAVHFSDIERQLMDTDVDPSMIDAQLDALAFLEQVSGDAARLAFVRGKLWHQFRGTRQALLFYDEALRLLDGASGDYAVVQAYRRRAARTLARADDADLVDAAAAEEAERSLIALARVAAANGVALPTRATDFDSLRRDVADAVRGAGVAAQYEAAARRRGAASPPLRLRSVTQDDLSDAVGLTWTSVELGGMCSKCLQRQRLGGVRRAPQHLPGASNAIDWPWLYAVQRDWRWTNERSQ